MFFSISTDHMYASKKLDNTRILQLLAVRNSITLCGVTIDASKKLDNTTILQLLAVRNSITLCGELTHLRNLIAPEPEYYNCCL